VRIARDRKENQRLCRRPATSNVVPPGKRGLLPRALEIFEAVFGPEHPEVARTLSSLGNVQHHLGEHELAR
jgi:hypothetical protein